MQIMFGFLSRPKRTQFLGYCNKYTVLKKASLYSFFKFYKLCTKWIKNVKKHPKSKLEQQKFQNTTVVNKIVGEVNQKLGLIDQLSFGRYKYIFETMRT